MPTTASTLWSTVARKFLLALTGLALFGFICVHLAGNLLMFVGPDAFNLYAHRLLSLGVGLYVAEAGLVAIFLIHIFTAATTTLANWKARPGKYSVSTSRGGASRMTFSSRTMIWTGLIVLVFLVVHIVTFKYGPGIAEGYRTTINGEEVRDLHRLVVEWFQNPIYAGFYVVVMALLGFHLRHGFWSAFQSLGGHHPRLTPVIYGVGVLAAIVLGTGFLVIPVWFFLGGSPS